MMLEKLAKIAQRYEALEQRLGDPAVYGDREKLKELSREQKELTPIVAAYREYRDACERADQAKELLSDEEMGELSSWLASVSPDITLHVTRFHPAWHMRDRGPTPVARVYALADVARHNLAHVYTGNC